MTPRILYVITKANWGGAQRYVFDLATSAKEAGNEVLVVSGAEGELTERLRTAGIAIKPIASLGRDIKIFAEFRALRELVHITREYSPHVIHGNSSKGGLLAGITGRLCGVPRIMFTAHGWAFNENRPWWQKKIIALVHWKTVLLSHQTICVSQAIARDIAHFPFIRSKIVVIPNGIDPTPLLPRDEARTRLAPFTAPLWIGTIAELHPIKQLEVLITAFAKIAPEHTDTVLVLMGEGEEREKLEALVQKEGLASRVHFCGQVRDASSYLSALDIFVLPSRSEALGYVLLEAGNASLPVIASNVGGIPEIITNQENGTLVPSGDSEAVANALTTLLGNEALRAKLGRALYERVLRVFSKEKTVRETLALYQST